VRNAKTTTTRRRMVPTWVTKAPVGDHTDPAVSGLQLRVRVTREGFNRAWCFRYKWRSEPVRIVIGHVPGMSLAGAREEAIKLRKALDDGIDPRRARPRRRPTPAPLPASASVSVSDKHSIEYLVSEFVERYLRPSRKRPEYAIRILQKDILPEWKGRDARTVEPHEVIALLDKIVDRGSAIMANRVAAILTQLFKFGIHRRIVPASPVQLLYRPGGKEKPRERTLTDDELRAYLKNPKAATRYQRLAHAITVLLLTGQRRGELALAKWTDVDLRAKTWTIPDENSKSGKGHIVPLSDWAAAEFQSLKKLAKGSAFVLPANGGSTPSDPKLLTRGVARCQTRLKELSVGAFTLHDLRRTCRTGLSRLKVQPHIAERVLNHAQERIAGTYDLWEYMEEKRAALEKWAAHLQGLRP
jgi:integrase